jgi:hypothetical protein
VDAIRVSGLVGWAKSMVRMLVVREAQRML